MNDPIINLEAVSGAYRRHTVLDCVSLAVTGGERVLITGNNGSGKTTLLRLISGTLIPSSGTVTVQGVLLNTRRRRQQVRRRIGMLTQMQHDPEIAISVLESVVLGLWGTNYSWCRRPVREDYERSRQRLALVDMLALEHHDMRTLSGGQRQRVALARALVRDPRIVLMDEPGTYLDRESKHDIFERILLLQKQMQFTLLVVSHEHQLADRFDRTIHLDHTTIQEARRGSSSVR